MHRHHGGTCCAGCFPAHTPGPVRFMTSLISHTWKYVLTIHPKGALCSFGDGHTGGACCAMDNQRQCSHGLSQVRQMQLAREGLDNASPIRNLNVAFPFQISAFYFSLALFFKEDLLSGTKLCFLQIGSQSIPLRQSTGQDQLGWLHGAGVLFEWWSCFFRIRSKKWWWCKEDHILTENSS